MYHYGRRCDRRAPSTTAHRNRTTQSVVDMARLCTNQSVPTSRSTQRALPPQKGLSQVTDRVLGKMAATVVIRK